MFLTLADINGDGRIEASELLAFFAELSPLVTADSVLIGMAQIIVSTDESFEDFMSLYQASHESTLSYMQFSELLASVFRTSKFETYLLFKSMEK